MEIVVCSPVNGLSAKKHKERGSVHSFFFSHLNMNP